MSSKEPQVRQEQAAGAQGPGPGHASVGIPVKGETVDELDLKALARGAKFFPPGTRLEVVPYQVTAFPGDDPLLQCVVYVREAVAGQPQGRPVSGNFCGPDAAALEAAALQAAREALGPEARLEVEPGYSIEVRRTASPGERCLAHIAVHEIPGGQ